MIFLLQIKLYWDKYWNTSYTSLTTTKKQNFCAGEFKKGKSSQRCVAGIYEENDNSFFFFFKGKSSHTPILLMVFLEWKVLPCAYFMLKINK